MSSLFQIETTLILMFISKQKEIKSAQTTITDEFVAKQREELFQFQQQLDMYKSLHQSNNIFVVQNREVCNDVWKEINYEK
jgi:hypothetical protein